MATGRRVAVPPASTRDRTHSSDQRFHLLQKKRVIITTNPEPLLFKLPGIMLSIPHHKVDAILSRIAAEKRAQYDEYRNQGVSFDASEPVVLICQDCDEEFIFTTFAQRYFVERVFKAPPRYCRACHARFKKRRNGDSWNSRYWL